jgi:hypothetical protein
MADSPSASPSAFQLMAQRIVAIEISRLDGDAKVQRELPEALERAFAQLDGLMSNLVGVAGFRALTRRAIHLSAASFPWLDKSKTSDPYAVLGSRAALATWVQQQGEAQVRACAETVLGYILELLCSFIGEDLTFRLLRRVWTDLAEGKPRSEGLS